ncbi:MAG: MCE family protein [Planctomycetes bacterium]|nr:MCE family protein [Planctomycetota bacterium]
MTSMKEVAVGLLFFSALIALGLLTIWLSDIPIFEETYQYEIYFDQANELRVKDDVLIMGKRQGKVVRVDYHDEPLWSDRNKCELWVSVQISMDVPLTLKEDYKIRIRNANLLGGKVMDIRLGKSRTPINPYKVMLVGLAVPDPIEAISDFVETNKGYVNHTLENIDHVMTNVSLWSEKVTRGEGTLGRLIHSESMANNMESFMADAQRFMSQLRDSEGVLGLILNDKDTRVKVKQIVDDVAEVAQSVAAGRGTVGKLLTEDTLHDEILSVVQRLDRLSAGLESGEGLAGKLFVEESEKVFEDFAKILANGRDITNEIRSGQGMLNTLIYDQTISMQLRGAAEKLAKIADDIDIVVQDVKDGKGPLGMILRDEELAIKVDQLIDSILGSIEDARESAPLVSLGSFLFGAI